jgi:hypothetical protein
MPKLVKPDLSEVEKLGALQCTFEEIGAWFKVDKRTINRWAKQPAFAEALERGKAAGRASLRRAQYQAAMNGNPAMLIWLGKQILDQKDKTEHTGEINLTVSQKLAAARQRLALLKPTDEQCA